MLYITVPANELWDEETQEFISTKETNLQLEHSLVSLSKWESKWHKAYFSNKGKTPEETIDYIRCMTITQNVKPEVYGCLTQANIDAITSYIEDPMTATTFTEETAKGNRETITAELIYHWMIALNIPFECQKWHINRLLTLIRVCSIKNQPPKQMSKGERLRRQAELNAQRRRQMNTKG